MKNYLINIISPYILKEELNKIINKDSNITYLNYEEIDINDIIIECSYPSLIDKSRVIIVKNFKLNESSSKIKDYLNNPNKEITLILLTNQIDKRTNLYKTIKDNITVIEIKELKPEDIHNKLSNYCKNNNIKIDYNSLNIIMNNNSMDIDLCINEIDKFNIITNNINEDIINKYSSIIPSDDSFELCDAIVEKKINKIETLLEDFIESRKEVIPFIALLALQYRYIYACKEINKSPDYLMKLFNVKSNYPFKKASTRVKIYTKEELKDILIYLSKIDLELKSTDKDKYMLLKQVIGYIM